DTPADEPATAQGQTGKVREEDQARSPPERCPPVPGGTQPRLWREGRDPPLPGRRPVVASRRHPRPLRRGTPSPSRCHPADVHGPDPAPLGYHPHLWPAIQDRGLLQAGPPCHRRLCLSLLDGGHDAPTARERQPVPAPQIGCLPRRRPPKDCRLPSPHPTRTHRPGTASDP